MFRKQLSDTSIFHDILPQKGLIFDTELATEEVIISYLKKQYLKKDFIKIQNSTLVNYLNYFLTDKIKIELFKGTIERGLPVLKEIMGLVQLPTFNIYDRDHNHVFVDKTPDLVVLVALNVKDNSSTITFDYDDHRRKYRQWSWPIKCDHFWIFPSDMKYRITRNNSEHINTYLIYTYEQLKD